MARLRKWIRWFSRSVGLPVVSVVILTAIGWWIWHSPQAFWAGAVVSIVLAVPAFGAGSSSHKSDDWAIPGIAFLWCAIILALYAFFVSHLGWESVGGLLMALVLISGGGYFLLFPFFHDTGRLGPCHDPFCE